MALADRRVGVAVDFSPCSKEALRWAVDNVVRDGDHLILVTVQKEGQYEGGETQLWEATGSRECPWTIPSPRFSRSASLPLLIATIRG